ncbi:MAG: hypothetical protein BAA01_12030 [Bacillus thermozeamaize]|uniref:Dephospho-CoA kinase n=1 Tax=Bacillus thermozeamaize TaxID=230954 RepID=A0A1Y3PKG5_9BACI|nr:MAG: hypothetical protein BAA01_12030 [Bacillus thermozeamaize]
MDDSSHHEIFIKEKSAVKPPIALTGKARSGKNTVAKYLDEKYGYVPFAFSDDIKRIAKDIFPWRFGKGKDREILQQVGEKMREIDPDVWVEKTLNRIDHFKDDLNIVITDLRMPNEYAACRERGFVIIKVDADDEVRRKRMMDNGDVFREEDLGHETENYVDGFRVDYVIDNNGDIESLYEQVDEIMKKITS